MSALSERLELLLHRLRNTYDGIGHSSGRPYVYYVYPPMQERAVRRLVDDTLRDEATLTFHHLDLLTITIASLAGQEERRQQLLNQQLQGTNAASSILNKWAGDLRSELTARLGAASRPVGVVRGLAALHPLGTPTMLMEAMAEREVRDPHTGRVVPIVLLVPGIRPLQTSRRYWFLGQERLANDFYRGEEA